MKNKDRDTSASHFKPIEDRWEWVVEHKTPNRSQRRKMLRDARRAAKKANREEKRLGQ